MEAVSSDGRALQWAPSEFHSDRGIVLAAASQNGEAAHVDEMGGAWHTLRPRTAAKQKPPKRITFARAAMFSTLHGSKMCISPSNSEDAESIQNCETIDVLKDFVS